VPESVKGFKTGSRRGQVHNDLTRIALATGRGGHSLAIAQDDAREQRDKAAEHKAASKTGGGHIVARHQK